MSAAGDEVLLVCYYFPPVGGAGVQRSQKLARYLPDEGFRPIVIAGPSEREGRWEPEDEGLLAELPTNLPVYRPSSSPPAAGVRHGRLARVVGSPPPRFRWWASALREAAERALVHHAPKLVYASLSPFEGLVPALELARELGVPLVADLRDPWALDEFCAYPSALTRRRELRAMQSQLARADLVLWNTPEALAAARAALPELPAERSDWLPNGYDGADFAARTPRAPDGRFRLVHSGYLHTGLGLADRRRATWRRALGGELFTIDRLGRSPWYLLQALEQLRRDERARYERIDVELLGVLSGADEALVRRSPVAARVALAGYRDHVATVRAQVAADALFLPLHALPRGGRARIVPAKTYEYLASGRPILGALPAGDARDFVCAARAGVVVEPDDVAGIARALCELVDGAPAALRRLDHAVQRFERRALCARLAQHFRALLAERPARRA